MNVNMMLTEGYKESRVKFPCTVSQKHDGVPVLFYVEDGVLKHKTRQGKELFSIPHIIDIVEQWKDQYVDSDYEGFLFVGELMIFQATHEKGVYALPFKDISGKVRKQEPCTDLKLCVFEIDDRVDHVFGNIFDMNCKFDTWLGMPDNSIYKIVQERVINLEELTLHLERLKKRDWEGIIIRHGEYLWETERPKRSYNSMRVVKELTADLKVVGLEEAVSKDGIPHGRVGAFMCEYKGSEIKVGAGKLTHKDAKDLWDNELFQYGRIIQVKYKKDDSYDALRQPTFQCFRDDKDEPHWDE